MYVCGCVSMSVVVCLYAEEEKLHQRRVIYWGEKAGMKVNVKDRGKEK